MRFLPVLLVASACVNPQVGYRDPAVPSVQLVDAATARARALRPEPLRVEVAAGVDDNAAAGTFLRAAAAHHAAFASDVSLVIGECRQPIAPIAQSETHTEPVSEDVTDTEQVPEQQCEQVADPTDPTDPSAIPSTHEECTTVYTTQTSSHTEWHDEDVTTTTWSLARAPGTCPPGGQVDAVEGTIYDGVNPK
jgi:hypothetical protein